MCGHDGLRSVGRTPTYIDVSGGRLHMYICREGASRGVQVWNEPPKAFEEGVSSGMTEWRLQGCVGRAFEDFAYLWICYFAIYGGDFGHFLGNEIPFSPKIMMVQRSTVFISPKCAGSAY